FSSIMNSSSNYTVIQVIFTFSLHDALPIYGHFAVVFYQAIGPDIVTYAETPLAYNDGEWHHAAGVLRGGLARIYMDGLLVARDTTNPITSVRTSAQTIVGQVASGFVGDIDD